MEVSSDLRIPLADPRSPVCVLLLLVPLAAGCPSQGGDPSRTPPAPTPSLGVVDPIGTPPEPFPGSGDVAVVSAAPAAQRTEDRQLLEEHLLRLRAELVRVQDEGEAAVSNEVLWIRTVHAGEVWVKDVEPILASRVAPQRFVVMLLEASPSGHRMAREAVLGGGLARKHMTENADVSRRLRETFEAGGRWVPGEADTTWNRSMFAWARSNNVLIVVESSSEEACLLAGLMDVYDTSAFESAAAADLDSFMEDSTLGAGFMIAACVQRDLDAREQLRDLGRRYPDALIVGVWGFLHDPRIIVGPGEDGVMPPGITEAESNKAVLDLKRHVLAEGTSKSSEDVARYGLTGRLSNLAVRRGLSTANAARLVSEELQTQLKKFPTWEERLRWYVGHGPSGAMRSR